MNMTVLDEGEIEIVFFNAINASRLDGSEEHPSGIQVIDGVYQVSFTTVRTTTSGPGWGCGPRNIPCDGHLGCNGFEIRRKIYEEIVWQA